MRRAVVLVMLGVVALGGCTQDSSAPPSPSPTPVQKPTPTPDAQAQALIDAEKAYRTNIAEQDRLYMAGGATTMPSAITDTATGRYLALTKLDLAAIKSRHFHLSAPTRVVGVVATWHAGTVNLLACEDRSAARVLDSKGRDRTPTATGSRRYRQSITVTHVGGRWKLSSATTAQVPTFDDQDCGR